MKKIRLVILISCCAAIKYCETPVSTEISLQKFTEGNDEFSNQCLKEQYNFNEGQSVILSPFSILLILAELALFSIGQTHEQLMNKLNVKYKEQIKRAIPELRNDLEQQSQVILELASRIYASNKYPLRFKFLYVTKTTFGAEAENVDFDEPEEAATTINNWVAKQTNNSIPDLVSPDMFNSLTKLVLVNAIYFKGNWSSPFTPLNTKDKNFYVNNIQRPIKVPTMYQQSSFKYREDVELEAKIIKLPYKGGNFSFYVLLPNTVEGLKQLLIKLEDSILINTALNELTTATVQLSLPKFISESTVDLKKLLPKLGVTDIFDENLSQLTGITKKNIPLYVSSGIQKAKIDVNEYGSQAAAATAVAIQTRSAIQLPTAEFIADHPFAYLLRYKDITLFCGTYTGK